MEQAKSHPAWITEQFDKPLVITISREFGSGGRNIGKLLAKKMGVPYYDTAIISMARKEKGFPKRFIRENEQNIGHRILFNLYDNYTHYATSFDSDRQMLFKEESKIITDLTKISSCVIVGRLSNFILRNRPNTFNVFISSNPEWAAQRIMLREHVDHDTAMEIRNRVNHQRQDHCRYFTDTYWGYGANYDLSLRSSDYGTAKTANIIMDVISSRLGVTAKETAPHAVPDPADQH
jgi:cytidylate kinase